MNEKNEKVEAILREARDAYAQAVKSAQARHHLIANMEFGRLVGFERVLWIFGEHKASLDVGCLVDDLLKMDKQECEV